MKLLFPFFGLAVLACSTAGPERAAIPLELGGEAGATPIETEAGPTLELDEARLAFGPLYFCASPSGAEYCDIARLEWLDTAVVDLLSDEPEQVGVLSGSTGPIASFLCDLSISSQLTQDDPFILEAAQALGGHSLRLRGTVSLGERRLPFSLDLAIAQTESTVQGVPVIQSPPSQDLGRDVTAELTGLFMQFSVARWLAPVDWTPYFVEGSCGSGAAEPICQGDSSVTCTDAGEVDSVDDCAEKGQICLPGRGCQDELVPSEGDAAVRSLKAAILSDFGPKFTWRTD